MKLFFSETPKTDYLATRPSYPVGLYVLNLFRAFIFAYASCVSSSMTVHMCMFVCTFTNRLDDKNQTRLSCLLYLSAIMV